MPRIDERVGLAQQVLARIFGNRAKPVVDIGDHAARIGGGDDGVLVERGLEVGNLLQRRALRFERGGEMRGLGGDLAVERGVGHARRSCMRRIRRSGGARRGTGTSPARSPRDGEQGGELELRAAPVGRRAAGLDLGVFRVLQVGDGAAQFFQRGLGGVGADGGQGVRAAACCKSIS